MKSKCCACQKKKELSEFYKDKSRKNGVSSRCKSCAKRRNVEYHAENRDKILARQKRYALTYVRKPENDRKSYLKSRYGISPEEYEKMGNAQDWKCAICGQKKPLRVDHDHETGAIRKLLCHHCNIGLGEFFDSVPLLQTSIKYLEEHERSDITA